MRFQELEPRWIDLNLLAFRCPHCREVWLTCKNIPITERKQREIFEREFGEDWNLLVVPCNPGYSWTIKGEFENLTIFPSIDATPSGHWHGFITDGEIR